MINQNIELFVWEVRDFFRRFSLFKGEEGWRHGAVNYSNWKFCALKEDILFRVSINDFLDAKTFGSL